MAHNIIRVSNDILIKNLIRDGYLKAPRIIDAFKTVLREDFVPPEIKDRSYVNSALPIGYGQTISQPLVVAFMLTELGVKEEENILDVGTGSGWVAGLLSYLVGNRGHVISIERIRELYEFSCMNLSKYDFVKNGILALIQGDGSLGYLPLAPYDKIIAAASGNEIPAAWKEQLKIGGRIVAPVDSDILVVDKLDKDKFREQKHPGFAFVPLIGGDSSPLQA